MIAALVGESGAGRRWLVACGRDRRLRVCPAALQRGKYSKCIHVLHNSAEKALEAVILAERKRPPRGAGGHNLVRLHAMVARQAKLSPRLVRTLDDLSPLYLPSEYPDGALGAPGTLFKKEQAQRYLREVGELVRWLKRRMSRD